MSNSEPSGENSISVSLTAAEWPPKKGQQSDPSDQTGDFQPISKPRKGETSSLHKTLAKDNMFVKKIVKEKGINLESEEKPTRFSVKDIVNTMESKGSKKQEEEVVAPKPDSKTKNLVKYYDRLSGAKTWKRKKKKHKSFRAKNAYTQNLEKRNLLTREEKQMIKKKVKRKSQMRYRPLKSRLSNKRPRQPAPKQRKNAQDVDNEVQNEPEVQAQKEGEIERQIIENERKLLNANMDNTIRNFFAHLKPVAHKRPSMKRQLPGSVAQNSKGDLELVGIKGSLDQGPLVQKVENFRPISPINKKHSAKRVKQTELPNARHNSPKQFSQGSSNKKISTRQQQKTLDLIKGFAEVDISVAANEAREMVDVKVGTPSGMSAKQESTKPSANKVKWWSNKKPSTHSVSRVPKSTVPTAASPKKQQSIHSLFATETVVGSKKTLQSPFQLEDEDGQSEEDNFSEFFRTTDSVGTGQALQIPIPGYKAGSVSSLNTFKTRAYESVASNVTNRTTQSLNSVLDPLSYVFTVKYREDLEDMQHTVSECFSRRNKRDPTGHIYGAVRKIKTVEAFCKEFGMIPEEAAESVDSFRPLLVYNESSSRPLSYRSFILLAAIRQLGYETRYSLVWLEVRRLLEIRISDQIATLEAEGLSTFAKLDALKAALTAMEDLHRIKAQVRGVFFRPCRQSIMVFLNAMANNVFSDSTERSTFKIVKGLHRKLKKILSVENRLRTQEVGVVLMEGSAWKCPLDPSKQVRYQRRLPLCGHVFNKDNIDEWLLSHYICPVCGVEVDKPKKLDATPCSIFIFEFGYYVLFLFPLFGIFVGSLVAGCSVFVQRNIFPRENFLVDLADRGFVKCVISSYVVGFASCGLITQTYALYRHYGKDRYSSDVWILLPILLGVLWSPFVAFLLSDSFQDPQVVRDADTLRETWKGFAALLVFYLIFVVVVRLFIYLLMPYLSWCFINFKESLREATCSEKFYAVYFWCCCSALYYCCFGDDEDIEEEEEKDPYKSRNFLEEIEAPEPVEIENPDDVDTVLQAQDIFEETEHPVRDSSAGINLSSFFADEPEKSGIEPLQIPKLHVNSGTDFSFSETASETKKKLDDFFQGTEDPLLFEKGGSFLMLNGPSQATDLRDDPAGSDPESEEDVKTEDEVPDEQKKSITLKLEDLDI